MNREEIEQKMDELAREYYEALLKDWITERKLILVNFGTAGDEYLFPEEILAEPSKA
jgi:hypothetical protein